MSLHAKASHPFIKFRNGQVSSSSPSNPTPLKEESIGVLQNNSKKPEATKKLISVHQFNKEIPLTTQLIKNWPEQTSALCLHCAEKITATPLPAVKYYDPQDDKFWVYGFFCRPCCSLAYVNEHQSTDNSRCLSWTQQILRKYFNYSNLIMKPAPPRCALKKFGGPMDFDQFYGNDGTVVVSCISPPFVTFSMYLEITNIKSEESTLGKEVHGLRRPTTQEGRVIATHESTDKPPEILNFLARMGINDETSFSAATAAAGSSSAMSDTQQSQEQNISEDSIKYKRRKQQFNEECISETDKKQRKKKICFQDDMSHKKEGGNEDRGTLTKYLVKN
jgi:hypothetical protein